MTFEVVFNYVGLWTEHEKEVAKGMLITVRNEMVDITNPLLETFNSEWDKLHPEVNGMEEGSDIWNEYNRFIAEKCNERTILQRRFATLLTGLDIRFDPELDAQIVVSNSNGGKAYITLKSI